MASWAQPAALRWLSLPVGCVVVILSDRTIKEEVSAGRIIIEPFDPSSVQPSSVDLRLDHRFVVFRNHTFSHIDVKANLEELTDTVQASDERPFILHPGEFVLGSTAERVAIPADLVRPDRGQVEPGSSRPPDPHHGRVRRRRVDGQLTLEFSNVASLPITLYPGMKIGQISFIQMTTEADQPYGSGELGSKYQGQKGPRPSRYWENF